jgi:hypothetical protein
LNDGFDPDTTENDMELYCPYCETGMDDPDECYEQDVTYEHECPHCEKNFVFTVEYTRTYSADKADCLNGAEHDYKKTATFPEEFAVMRCKMCSHEKPIPKGSNG